VLRASKDDVLLSVFVKPNRSKSAIVGRRVAEGRAAGTPETELEVALAAPPPKRSLELASGQASRHKVVRLVGTSVEAVEKALEAAGWPAQ
jgi:uncharacterized protein YggU (UPF0235/DUF167 family)